MRNLNNQIWLSLLIGLTWIIPRTARAQTFTFDYLTAVDKAGIPERSRSFNPMMTFFFTNGAFDSSGNTSGNLRYLEFRVYFASARNFNRRVQLVIVFDLRGRLAEGAARSSMGEIWFLTKYRYTQNAPITLRLGFKLGRLLADDLWLNHNELDLGLLLGTDLGDITLTGSLAYRLQGNTASPFLDFSYRYDNPGNAVHYRMGVSTRTGTSTRGSLFLIGYQGGDKKTDGMTIKNSFSRKITAGATFRLFRNKSETYEFSFLVDLAGRHDMKGISLVVSLLR